MRPWGEGDRAEDPDATGVLPRYPGGLDAPTHVYPTVPSRYPEPADATVEQPVAREATEYPGGFDDTHPLPAVPYAAPARSAPAGPPPGSPPPTAPSGPEESAEAGAGASVARNSTVMALGSIISRATGFIRTAAIGAVLGAAAVGDAYTLANILPGMVYELLLGGVLTSVVVPLLVRARGRDADRGEAYTQRLLSLATVSLAAITVLAVLVAPLFTALLASDHAAADRRLITTLAYLLLPMIFFYGVAALFAAVLNTRGHFAAPTFAPILNNIVVIAMCGTFLLTPAIVKDDPASLTAMQIALLGLGTTLGIVVQAAGLLPALRRFGFRWRWRWDFRALHLPELGRAGGWMFAYVAVSQAAVFVIFTLAGRAGAAAGGAGPMVYNNAFLIFMMAHGIIAVSVITALMPRMSAAAAEQRHGNLADLLSLGTRLTSVVLVPAMVGYVVLGRPLAVTLFEWGNYDHESALATGWVIAVAGLGLLPFAVSQLQLFAFYAMPDTKTPALINLPVVAVRIGVDLLLYIALPATLVAAGLMGGNAISFGIASALGYLLLRQRIGRLGLGRVFGTLSRLALAGVIAAVPTMAVLVTMIVLWGDAKGASFLQLALCGPIMVAAYLGAASWLRIPEVSELLGMLRSRLRRAG